MEPLTIGLGAAALAGAGWLLQEIAKRAAGVAADATVKKLQEVPLKRVVRRVLGEEIKANGDRFSLVICALLNDAQHSHTRYISTIFQKMRNIDVIVDKEPISLHSAGRLTEIMEKNKERATNVLKSYDADIVIFGEVLKEHTSIRLIFCTRLGAYDESEEPFIIQDSRLPDRFKASLATLAVAEITNTIFDIQRARRRGLPYELDPGLNKLVSIEEDHLLESNSYRFAALLRTKMKLLLVKYIDSGNKETIEDAISAGHRALEIYHLSPYEHAATALDLCKCLYIYAISSQTSAPLDEIETLSVDICDLYERPPAEFDFGPFDGRRSQALIYVLSRNLQSTKPAKEVLELVAQSSLLRGILNWDPERIKLGIAAVAASPIQNFEYGLTSLEGSIALARLLHDRDLGERNVAEIESQIASAEIPKLKDEVLNEALEGKDLKTLENDPEILRLAKYWGEEHAKYLAHLKGLALTWHRDSRLTLAHDGRLIDA